MSNRLTAVLATIFVVLGLFGTVAHSYAAAPADHGKDEISIGTAATIGSTKIGAGTYEVEANGSSVTFTYSAGGTAAKAPIQWKDEPSKATESTIDIDGDKITAIHFKGKTRFAAVSQ